MNEFIIIVSILVLFCSYYLFKRAGGTLSLCYFNSITFVFYYSIIISTFIGAILCACGYGKEHWTLCYTGQEARINAWLAVCYSMIAMPVGMIMINNVIHFLPRTALFNYIQTPLQINLSNSRLKTILCGSVIFSLLIFLYIKLNSGSWPLYTAIVEKDYLAAMEERVDVRRNFHGIIYIKNLIGQFVVLILSYYSYIIAIKKRKIFYWLCFLMILIISLLILSYDTQKAPTIFYLGSYLVIRVLIKGPIPLKWIFLSAFIALVLMSILYLSFNSQYSSIFDILLNPKAAMWGRMFISGYAGVPLTFEWFPDVIRQPMWQIGLPEFILNALDLPSTESARLMMLKIEPSGNLISSYYIAEAWANYGIIGVIIAPFIVGFNVQIIQIFLLKSKKEPLVIAFYAYMATHWVISSSFVNYLFFKTIILSFILYYITKFIIYKLTFKKILKNKI